VTAVLTGPTELERSTLRAFALGKRTDQIAAELGLATYTVRGLLHRMCAFDVDRARRILAGLDVSEELYTTTAALDPVPEEPAPVGEGLSDMLAAGLSYRRLDYWTRTGLLHAVNDAPGSGTPRRWQDGEAAIGALVVRLTDAGLDLQVAFRVARDGQHELAPGIRLLIEPPEEANDGQA
jgi:hypothetical protein